MCIIEFRVCRVDRKKLIKILVDSGFVFLRHGANHDIYIRGDRKEAIPRHNEVNELLAKAIIKRIERSKK